MKQPRKSKHDALKVNGKTAGVVQDAEADDHLLDVAARVDAREEIRQGLDDARKLKTQPGRKFFDRFEAEHGI